jgi:hypothetical protein
MAQVVEHFPNLSWGSVFNSQHLKKKKRKLQIVTVSTMTMVDILYSGKKASYKWG